MANAFVVVFGSEGFRFLPPLRFQVLGEIFFSQLGLLMVIFCLFGWFGCSCFFFFGSIPFCDFGR